jgi:hypothetical protein
MQARLLVFIDTDITFPAQDEALIIWEWIHYLLGTSLLFAEPLLNADLNIKIRWIIITIYHDYQLSQHSWVLLAICF